MRIVIITQGVSRIITPLISNFNIVGIIESAPRGHTHSDKINLAHKIKNLATRLTQKDYTLKFFCQRKKIQYQLLTTNNEIEVSKWLKSLSPDLLVVFSMSQLIRENILSIPRLGAINLHPSFLPSYRGPNPDFWQYYYFEQNPGVTIHYIDKGEDTGNIINQERTYIAPGTKSPDRLNKLIGEIGNRLLIKSILEIQNGAAASVPQPHESPTPRARNLKPDEHKNIVDWGNWPIERVWNLMRGTELWLNCIEQPSGLYTGHRWIVGEYEKTKEAHLHNSARLGSILKDHLGYYVACKDGKIRIRKKLSLIQVLKQIYKYI